MRDGKSTVERREAKVHKEGRRGCGRNETTPGTVFEMLGGRFFIQFADISGDFLILGHVEVR